MKHAEIEGAQRQYDPAHYYSVAARREFYRLRRYTRLYDGDISARRSEFLRRRFPKAPDKWGLWA